MVGGDGDVQVVLGQHLEGLEATIRHLDMLVHPAWPDQRWVQLVHVVGGEDDDTLAAARRPQPVNEVEHPTKGQLGAVGVLPSLFLLNEELPELCVIALIAGLLVPALAFAGKVDGAVNVLDDDDGLSLRLNEELPELCVVIDRRELEVVDIILKVVGYGGDHRGLSSAGGAKEQLPTLPCLADLVVVALSLSEGIEVVDDGLLLRGVHGKRIERRRVLERHVAPAILSICAVGEEAALAVVGDDGAALSKDVGQI
uniref:Uncharacterized protein n=1 Tax=Triticum urartu TaxID=4572 RepID=A0A8R7RG12_TRIUA